ncbi:MAG: roadblock/LC7 domain-containing protein [Gemmatimonadales bacterium]|jgi:predicted regulator of Ras-like GTPase activity (Roadblock/LC7/MglB family)
MPTIHDVVQALGSRDGVDAVLVLGQDGLTIDAHTTDGLDPDGLAALVPSLTAACEQLGTAASRGGFGVGLVEYTSGMVLVSQLTADTLLAVVFAAGANVGSHLYELKRHRAAIAELL